MQRIIDGGPFSGSKCAVLKFPRTLTLWLPCLALLLGGCATVRNGVVVAKGSRVKPAAWPPVANYWVDVRGRGESGAKVRERVLMFKADWQKIRKGDSVALTDFGNVDLAATARKLAKKDAAKPAKPPGSTGARIAAAEKAPPKVAERLAPKKPAPKRDTALDAEARAHEDAAVREAKRKIHTAATPEEQTRAWEEYRSTLQRKIRELAPGAAAAAQP